MNGRYITPDGYVMVYRPKHPFANYNGYVKEHRLVMEQHLGRYLTRKEIVHHIDGNKQNNIIENLYKWTQSDHAAHHKPHKKDLSNRHCFMCLNNNTRNNYKGNPHWFRHPITRQEWLCKSCYEKIYRELRK